MCKKACESYDNICVPNCKTGWPTIVIIFWTLVSRPHRIYTTCSWEMFFLEKKLMPLVVLSILTAVKSGSFTCETCFCFYTKGLVDTNKELRVGTKLRMEAATMETSWGILDGEKISCRTCIVWREETRFHSYWWSILESNHQDISLRVINF